MGEGAGWHTVLARLAGLIEHTGALYPDLSLVGLIFLCMVSCIHSVQVFFAPLKGSTVNHIIKSYDNVRG